MFRHKSAQAARTPPRAGRPGGDAGLVRDALGIAALFAMLFLTLSVPGYA
jgi:hypothetical protein